MTDTPESAAMPPSRVVDAKHTGWYLTRDAEGAIVYSCGYGKPTYDYAALAEAFGPLRPVVPPSEESSAELRRVINAAGNKAVGSLLVALSEVALDFAKKPGKPEYSGSLIAGREGSWEAERLTSLAWSIGLDLADRPKRFDRAAVDGFKAVLLSWVTGDNYTEVAETLAWKFSSVADEHGGGIRGWAVLADGPFQPGNRFAHPPETIERVYSWLMSVTHDGYEGLYEYDFSATTPGAMYKPAMPKKGSAGDGGV